MSQQPQNTLDIQRRYFEYAVRFNPRDETVRFALAQVLKDSGLLPEADECYDAGISLANRAWLAKLPVFILVPAGISAILWFTGVHWLWLPPVLVAIGFALWFMIRRNRQHWLPQVGFMQRQGTIGGQNGVTSRSDRFGGQNGVTSRSDRFGRNQSDRKS